MSAAYCDDRNSPQPLRVTSSYGNIGCKQQSASAFALALVMRGSRVLREASGCVGGGVKRRGPSPLQGGLCCRAACSNARFLQVAAVIRGLLELTRIAAVTLIHYRCRLPRLLRWPTVLASCRVFAIIAVF